MTEATFQVAELSPPLRITEIMYNPIGGDTYEFLEVQNLGTTAVDLGLMYFRGDRFHLPAEHHARRGRTAGTGLGRQSGTVGAPLPGITPAGYFGSALSNGGEYLALLDAAGNVVTSVTYDDTGRWPTSPDGTGRSLELVDFTGDPTLPESWRASAANNGTPMAANQPSAPVVRFNEVLARNAGAVANGAFSPDYVELHNTGATAVNIGLWSVRVEGMLTGACLFPPGTSIPAGGHLVVWCGPVAAGFKTDLALPDARGFVTLNDSTNAVIDTVNWGEQVPDKSVGRVAVPGN